MAPLDIDGLLLLDGGNEGIPLAITADVLTLKIPSEDMDGLESAEGSVSRHRLGLEAVRPFPLSHGASLFPSPSNRGPSLSIGHAMGAIQMPSSSTGQRFEAELADGFPACDHRTTITPALALVVSVTSRSYGLLWSLAPFAEQTRTEPMAALPRQDKRQEQNGGHITGGAFPQAALLLTHSSEGLAQSWPSYWEQGTDAGLDGGSTGAKQPTEANRTVLEDRFHLSLGKKTQSCHYPQSRRRGGPCSSPWVC